jgi:CRP-like cAMP-binding protein
LGEERNASSGSSKTPFHDVFLALDFRGEMRKEEYMFFPSRKKTSPYQSLKAFVLFQNLSNRELARLSSLLHYRSYQNGEIVFDEGEEGQGLFLVSSGLVEISGKSSFFANNTVKIKPGEFLGEIALLENAPRSAQARAVENTELIALFRTDFFNLLETDGKIAAKISMQLARYLSKRLKDAIQSKV